MTDSGDNDRCDTTPTSAAAGHVPRHVGAGVRTLVDIWEARRGARPMPRRQDFDPADVPRLLPGLILIDVEGERSDGTGIYRYRVVGAYEVDNRGHNPTGRLVEEGYFAESLESALADYERVRTGKRPVYAPVSFLDDRGRSVAEESILLPFSEDGGTVSQILVYSERQVRTPGSRR